MLEEEKSLKNGNDEAKTEKSLSGEQQNEKKNDGSQNEKKNGDSQNENKAPQISVWEWLTAFVGLALVVGAIGFTLYKAIWGSEEPPDIKIRIESIEPRGDVYLVKFSALNQGGYTAAGLALEAELTRGAEKIETSHTTIDFLPSHSVRNGGFYFRKDPRQYDLQTRAVGYEQP